MKQDSKVLGKDLVPSDSKKSQKFIKGRKRRGSSRDSDIAEKKPYLDGVNDIKWRTSDTVMTKLVGNLPFGLAAGLTQDITVSSSGTTVPFRQPGVMGVSVDLTLGMSSNYNSAVNLAARKIYSFVRHANSGSKNYEAADLALYLGSIAQVLGLLGYMQRGYTVLNHFSTTNRYTPRLLARAIGWDYDDMVANQPQLKYLIAWLGRAIGSLAFPDLPYFKACYEAFKYIYVDNDSPKEQFYMLVPHIFGRYNPTYNANGGGIVYSYGTNPFYNGGDSGVMMTFQMLYNYTHDLVDVLLSDEDCGIISGDILKAFPNGTGLFKPEAFGEDYDLLQHSKEFLQQVHNATLSTDQPAITAYQQNPGNTNTAPFIEINWFTGAQSLTDDVIPHFVIDAFSRDPDAEEVVNCTVLNHCYKLEQGSSGYNIDPTTMTFDLFYVRNIFMYDDIYNIATPRYLAPILTRWGSTITGTGNFSNTEAVKMTNFDWHPLSIRVKSGEVIVLGDIQNFRFFNYEVSTRIHENSMLSLLAFSEHNFVK